MGPLAAAKESDYRSRIEQKGIEEHRRYIDTQMELARTTSDDAQRSECLANAVAANGMLLRGMSVGFVTGEPNYKTINTISAEIQSARAFRSLMADGSGERLAKNGSVDAILREMQKRDRTLAEETTPSRTAIDVIRGVQLKARARTAQPRDYAMLAAAHRLSSRRGKARAPDGKLVDVVRRDMNRMIDGGLLNEETERVLNDPDFQYVMKHEKPETLYVNALRTNGTAFEQYPQRAERLRSLEKQAEQSAQAPEAPQQPPQPNRGGPAR